METAFMDVDDIWRTLGRWGPFQLTQFLILIVAGIPQAFHILSVVFIGLYNEHVCNDPGSYEWSNKSDTNTTVHLTHGSCSSAINVSDIDSVQVIEVPCSHGYNYSQSRDRSFVSEWNLVCDKEPLGKLSQTMVMAGMMVGASLLPQIGDKYGRKKLHVSSNITMFVTALIMAFNPNFYGFLFLRFVIGMCQQGFLLPEAIHILELFPAGQRELVGFLMCLPWPLSLVLTALIAYITRNYSWRTTQIVLGAFSAFSLIEIWLLEESLRWLVANKKHDDVVRIVKKACRMNNKDFTKIWQRLQDRSESNRMSHISQREEVRLLEEENGENIVVSTTSQTASDPDNNIVTPKTKLGYMDLLKNRTLRPYALIMCYTWITNSLTYYGLALLTSEMAGDVFVNFLLGGVVEIPAMALMFILFKKIGRKKTVIFFHTVAGVCLLVAVLIRTLAGNSPVAGTCVTVFSLAGRFAITGSFNSVWLYTPEIFPTNIRNVGFGLASSAARVGGMASPFFNSLARIAAWGPGAIFSALCLLVTVLITFLPETTGRELPQTVEELEAWGIRDKKKKRKEKSKSVKT